jgi:quinoprotein glucose dehydrogenase
VPGAKVAPGYGVVSLTLNNGAALGGVLLAEAAESYDLVAGTDTWRVKKSDVKSATAPMSACKNQSATRRSPNRSHSTRRVRNSPPC